MKDGTARPAIRKRPIELKPLTVALTARELEVLSLLCRGLSNKAISSRLDITVNTVKVHLGKILSQLGVSSRLEAVLLAQRLGLVSMAAELPRGRQTRSGSAGDTGDRKRSR